MSGRILFEGDDLWGEPETLLRARRRWGVLFQSGALLGNLTVLENVMLPLREFTELTRPEMTDIAMSKLEMVGMIHAAYEKPMEISGGMQKRAALARAMALDPDVLFFDEPSAGLDPVSSRRLDDLILQIRDTTGATVIMVTHELPSIFAIADDSIFLDAVSKTLTERGDPRWLREHSQQTAVRHFLRRETGSPGEPLDE
jgi:phospholipid/cholesterol/gamma-HCH transport system ATP-binding protein